MALFAMLATMMFVLQVVMEVFPNIHLTGMLVMCCTVVFRKKALIPIYLYVMMIGVRWGFSLTWVPYLYLWTVLWGVTMLLPKRMPKGAACVVYPLVCALHGLSFGLLYAPFQAWLFRLSFSQTMLWIASGFYFDLLHAAGNLSAGILIFPLSELMKKLLRTMEK
jgi:energy-coupling factor transport system substrate-specific component